MFLNLLIYFGVGILQDFMWTLNVKYVAQHKQLAAAGASFLTSAISMLVIYNILSKLDSERSIIAILVYCLGIGVGTILGMRAHSALNNK